MIKLVVPGNPKGKGRPRFSKWGAYTDKATKEYESRVKDIFEVSGQQGYMDKEPLFVQIKAFYNIPESYTKKRKKAIMDCLELPTKKPDADNIAKIILDALNGLAYEDDTQVITLNVIKLYDRDNKGPRVEVSIQKLV